MEKMKIYPEEFVFHLAKGWKATIRGGSRIGQISKENTDLVASSAQLSADFSKKLMSAFAREQAEKDANHPSNAPYFSPQLIQQAWKK